MRNPTRDKLLAALASGELAALAKVCATQAELAESIGMTEDAYRGCANGIRASGVHFPRFHELRAARGDFDEEERTEPGINDVPWHNKVDVLLDLPAPRPRTVADDIIERRERAEVTSLKARLKQALEQLEQCGYTDDTARAAEAARDGVEPIRPREHSSGLREATAVALASDWHVEENVEGHKVNGVNEYNLEIARYRASRYFAGLTYLIKYHQAHFVIRDLALWLGGDLITGYLRNEDMEDNECSPVQAIAALHVWISEGIRHVLETTDIELMSVVCNSGNHGRLTHKMQPRTREANSIEWLLYVGLDREFANEPRVKFTLPYGSQTYVNVYEFVLRFTHGDETKFGGGIGGIMIPIRKAIAKWQTVRHADLTIMGHYHQEHFLRDLVVNGSLIGYNEYALSIAAPYEDPRQGFFLVDKHRGMTFPATVWVADREGVRR